MKNKWLSNGVFDNLIPLDLSHRNGRKVRNAYVQLGAEENFTHKLTNTTHPWDVEDLEPLRVPMPADCLSTAQLSELVSGKKAVEGEELADVFAPTFCGKKIDPDQLQLDVGRGDVMRVFAQFECTLYNPE